jgi:hypothetical protein
MGVRFILLPLRLDPTSDVDIVPDSPIVGALPDQLDLAELEISGAVRVWENDAWVPMRADVTLVDQASGGAVTSNDDAPPAEPVLIETTAFARFEGPLEGGSSVYQAAGGSGWRLDIDGEPVAREPAGGWASSFDVDRGGEATLAYDTPASRSVLVLVGLVVWAVVLVLLLRARAGPDEVDEVDDESRAAGEDAA